jgi:hypothetical protein
MGSVTIGTANYAIYGSATDATTYLAARIDAAAWGTSTDTVKAQALVSATRLLQRYGAARGLVRDPAATLDAILDAELVSATYELAFLVSQDTTIIDTTTTTTNMRKVKAGSAEVEYFRPVRGGRFPASVQVLVNAWLTANGAGANDLSTGTVEGADNESSLTPEDYQVRAYY